MPLIPPHCKRAESLGLHSVTRRKAGLTRRQDTLKIARLFRPNHGAQTLVWTMAGRQCKEKSEAEGESMAQDLAEGLGSA